MESGGNGGEGWRLGVTDGEGKITSLRQSSVTVV